MLTSTYGKFVNIFFLNLKGESLLSNKPLKITLKV